MRSQPKILGLVLAGGEGKRLYPLTEDRAKPAVPFGGAYRLIDFVLSNMVNANYHRICVLTQYKSHSLNRHLSQTWHVSGYDGDYITTVPAQQRSGKTWYAGSADAIYQSLNLINDDKPDYIVVFGADHVYRMDPSQMVEAHIESGAQVTVAGLKVDRNLATEFGCIDADSNGVITQFLEKPEDPPAIPGEPDKSFVSMGNYVFSTKALVDSVLYDSKDANSKRDMGGDIIPYFVKKGLANVYDFSSNTVPGETDRDKGYWRDVGTIDAYYDAHMDLVSIHPIFNLYNREWPIRSGAENLPPAKFVQGGLAQESIVGAGSIVSGSTVKHSVISSGVMIEDGAYVEDSVLLPGVKVESGAYIKRAIVDKNVIITKDSSLGLAPNSTDFKYKVSPSGIVVVGKNAIVDGKF